MRKLSFLMAVIWALSLVLTPHTSSAKLIEMSDNELNEITGQAGLILNPEDTVEFDIQGEKISFIDDGNVFSLSNIIFQGSISNTDMQMEVFSETREDGKVVTGFDLNMNNIDITIDKFMTDVQIGNETLFTYGLWNFNAQISGNVRIMINP